MKLTKYFLSEIPNSKLNKILNISGIYCIHKRDRRVYVGSSKNLIARWRHHYSELKNKKHKNAPLQYSYNKGDSSDLYFTILEQHINIDKLFEREAHWISIINPTYNMELVPTNRPDKSQYWAVCTPEDKWLIVKNLFDYCKDNNLSMTRMLSVAKGDQKSLHRGYFCRKLSNSERDRLRLDRYTKTILNKDKVTQGIIWREKLNLWDVFTLNKPRKRLGQVESYSKAKKLLNQWIKETGYVKP